MELKDVLEQIKSGTLHPDKAKLEQLTEMTKKVVEIYAVESKQEVVINGKPARLIIYKRGVIEVQFRDMVECKAAIEKLLSK